LVEHNQRSNGRMGEAVIELQAATGYTQSGAPVASQSSSNTSAMDSRAAIRQQLLSGTYGTSELGVGHGHW